METIVAQIAIFTEHDLTAYAVRNVLSEPHGRVIQVRTVREALYLNPKPDVLLIDEHVSTEADFVALLTTLRRQMPRAKLIVLAPEGYPIKVWQAIQQGVNGYLCMTDRLTERLPQLVQEIDTNRLYLSPSAQLALATVQHFRQQRLTNYQHEVLRLMLKQWTVTRIANDLGRSRQAIYQVQRYLREVFDATNNADLLHILTELGFQ